MIFRFGAVEKEKFPLIKLFIQGKEQPIEFDGSEDEDFTVDKIRSFVKLNNPDIYIGAPGCYEAYDKIARKFGAEKKEAKRKEMLSEAESLWDKAEGFQQQRSAEIYVKTMRKILEKGESFVENERARINKIMKGDMAQEKRQDFNIRLNILDSFALAARNDEL